MSGSEVGMASRPALGLPKRLARRLRPLGAERRTLAQLTAGYCVALLSLALLVAFGGWLVHDMIARQERHAAVVNAAGFQRTLSERAATFALKAAELEAAERAALAQAIAETAAALGRAHAGLAGEARRAVGEGAEALRNRYFAPGGLDEAVRAYAADGSAIAERIRQGEDVRGSVARFAADFDALRPKLYAAVGEHEGAARADARAALRLHLGAVAAALALLLLEALVVFRPLARHASAAAGRLEREAASDALTGLPNRRAALAAIEGLSLAGLPAAVVILDLDHFKALNDGEGHAAGDAALREAGERLRGGVRDGDLAARFGGDEFLCVLRGVAGETEALAVAGRLCEALAEPFDWHGQALPLGATAGVAILPPRGAAEEAVRAADEALLEAKRERRGTAALPGADPARTAAVLRALSSAETGPLPGIRADLQPVVSLSDGTVRGVEALARWLHPSLGVLSPGEFLPLSERRGLAHRVMRQARGDALRQFAALKREGLAPARLSLNLSAAELLRADVADTLEAEVAAAGLGMESVTLEITEDAVLDRVAHATLGRLAALRERGARIALDDFGTGTSGLAQLLRVPLDAVKLDRSFVRSLGGDGRAEKVVAGVVRLAHSMGLAVVAEGVETEGDAALLRELGCDIGQGWLWAPALPEAELRGWLADRTARGGNVVPLAAKVRLGSVPRVGAAS